MGANLATHTGWYFGIKQGLEPDNVQLVNGPTGLRMRGSLGPSGGSGTLTLADGSSVAFDVEPARGDAGLYDFEDAANLVGFIRANDGMTAGSSILRVAGTGLATTAPTTTSTAVTIAPTSPTPLPATTVITTVVPTIPLVIDAGARIVTAVPITSADKRVITRSGPVVIFMMHGMADSLGLAPAGARDDFANCAGPKDTAFYGRCEWGQDFLPALFGSPDARAQLTALDGSDVTGDQFLHAMENVRGSDLPDENLGHRLAGDCVADPELAEKVDGNFAKHFVAAGPLNSSSQIALAKLRGIPPTPPPVAAMVTWRDPTRGLVFSGRRVTRQIYAALRWYESTYQVTPGVILLGQSFGGLASRFMLSRPDPATLLGNETLNHERIGLCKEDLAKMDYVRDRTLYLVTLATPHEGSALAEWGPPVLDALRSVGTELRSGVANSSLAKVMKGAATIASVVDVGLEPTLTTSLVSSIDGFLPQLETARALLDMQLKRMEQQNANTLSPSARAVPRPRRSSARRRRSFPSTPRSRDRRGATPSTAPTSSKASGGTRPSARRRAGGSSRRCSSRTCERASSSPRASVTRRCHPTRSTAPSSTGERGSSMRHPPPSSWRRSSRLTSRPSFAPSLRGSSASSVATRTP